MIMHRAVTSYVACIMFCVRILKIIDTVHLIFALLTKFLFSVMLIADNNNKKKKKIRTIRLVQTIVS